MSESPWYPPVPEYVAARGEVLVAEAHHRIGLLDGPPPADHTLVVTATQHRYVDTARGVNEVMYPGQYYFMANHRVANNVAANLVRVPADLDIDWWTAPGRILAAEPCDASPLVTAPREHSLQIVAGTGYDPGAAAFRLHTAINETTQHASAFVRWGDSNPHCSLRQYDGILDAAQVRHAVGQADVIHHHVAPFLTNNTGMRPRRDQLVIRHYHGSLPKGTHLEPVFDTAQGYLLLGARLSLLAEAKAAGVPMDWSPIPVPVARYRALRDAVRAEVGWVPLEGPATAARPLRIAHSPTNERLKGTEVLAKVVSALRSKGVPVEVDFIRGVSLAESLRRKALCDVCFDSFWLGIQGSGLEAGAMELPVIAGDRDAAALYEDEIGAIPYTFADNADELAFVIEQQAMSPGRRWIAASITADYVAQYHDYAAVARRYEDTLSRALGRDVVTKHAEIVGGTKSTLTVAVGERAPVHIAFTKDETVLRAEGEEAAALLTSASPIVGKMIVEKVWADQAPEDIFSTELLEDDLASLNSASIPESGGEQPRTLLGLPVVEDPTIEPGVIELRSPGTPRRQRRPK